VNKPRAKALAIDTKKDKIYYAGAALLLGLLAAAFLSNNAKAHTANISGQRFLSPATMTLN
jgi:hypothetical protein